MEVVFPEPYCEYSPTRAHYYLRLVGGIWRCPFCWVARWYPVTFGEAIIFSNEIARRGVDRAYQIALRDRPKVRHLLAKLEDIRLLRKVLPQEELMEVIAAIIVDEEAGIEEEVDYNLVDA